MTCTEGSTLDLYKIETSWATSACGGNDNQPVMTSS